ncbi:hypothetical protein CkaCkLH20_12855 [Colletotrichum karsti]|uniref:C2H2-type domain-containing protein n=1 Tax=Colletotrichum karsti TaxID=1095194 RepID=A0A9P6LDW6_9PEZI|nr:uncharacterized protein CkaCkLH20_12855 [Colletotrichum karsti]KAF9869668.1 hypothetical protein CkaCkLH20_12855 [Colletotrichum karsti]
MSDTRRSMRPPTDRYSPLIRPTDEAWKTIEDEFKSILSDPTVRIQQILDDHFTDHEKKLFLPATQPRSLRECQEDNTERYHALFQGRFKGHPLSLATKFTMLYFGLPVEPVLSHLFGQGKPTFDVDDWEDLHEAEVCPPLHFLTAHDRRNFGHDNMRGTEAHYSTIPVPASQLSGATDFDLQESDSQGLSLRGGGLDDDDNEDGDHDMPDMEKQPRRQLFSGPGLVSKVFGDKGNGSSSKLPTSNRHTKLFGLSSTNPTSNAPAPGRTNTPSAPQSKLLPIPKSTHGGTFNTSPPKSAAGGIFSTPTPKPAASTQPTASHAGVTAGGQRPNPSSSVGGFVPPRPSGFAPPPAGSNPQSFGGYFPPSSFGPKVQSTYSTSTPSADTFVQLFGFQGRVSFDSGNLSTLQEATRKLLSLKQRDQCDVILAHISRNGGKIERSFETTIRDISKGEVAQYVDEQKSNRDCVWFTHRKGETTPTDFAPTESEFLWNLVKLRHVDSQGQENLSYLGMPNRGKFFHTEAEGERWPTPKPWGINHYMPFLKTAQEVLIGRPKEPGESDCDIRLSNEFSTSRSFARQWFGGLEIDHELWKMMHPRCNGSRPFNVATHPLAEGSVIFHLPGRLATSEMLQMRQCFRREGSDDPYPEARRTLETLIRNAHIPLRPSYYRIWRGTDFFSSTIYPAGSRRPVRWNHLAVNAESQDQQAISKFIQEAVEDPSEACRFFVVQPMDDDEACRIRLGDANSSHEDFNVDTHRMDSFKSKIRRLYEGHPEKTYEPGTDSILIEPVIDERYWNQSQFVLRANASNNELAMIRRLIIATEVRVTVVKDDASDYVAQLEKCEWGPRYGEVTPFRREMGHPTLSQPSEHFVMPPKKQPSPRRTTESRMEPRERTWAQQPGIFDKGVYNPAIPINAPAVEQIMRTGGTRVPMVSKAVLTSTEQRQLQSDLWTMRGMVLDRLSRCPYEGCRYAYRLDQEEEFLKHLEGSHVGDRCPWCSEQLFQHWSWKQKEDHFKTKHEDVFRKVLDMPQPTPSAKRQQLSGQAAVERAQDILSAATIAERVRPPVGPPPKPSPPTKANSKESEYRFCDRCGRDHQTLSGKTERDHHDRCCVPLAEGAGRCTFCETCGDNVWNSLSDRDELAPYDDYPHRCRGTSHAGKPYCVKCGLSLKKLPDDAIDRHREHCGGFFGDVGCFCPYCQKSFVQDGVQKHVEEIRKHITDCTAKKPPNITPFDIYPESYWNGRDQPSDSLFLGEQASNELTNFSRPRGPSRYLSHPLAWHDKPGPHPCQDPPSECTAYGCREPLFGLTPSEVLAHFETKHYGIPLPRCPLCHLSFQRPKEVREEQPELGEYEDRRLQVAHMECHVFQLWDILAEKRAPPPVVQGPFGPGHTLWDPENENALDRRDKRCPYFEKCGAMVGFMSQQQWNSHMEAAHASEDFVGGMRPNREAVMRAADEERRKQRIREGKHPIPGMLIRPPGKPFAGIRPGNGPGQGSTNSAPPAQPGGSRPEPSENPPQEPGSETQAMEGVETSHGHEVPDNNEEEQDNETDGQLEEDLAGGGSQPPKTQPKPTGPVPVPTSTSKPPTKPKPTGPVPVPPSSTTKPPKTQPKPTGPVPVPPSSTTKPPKTQPKPTGPVPVPTTSTTKVPKTKPKKPKKPKSKTAKAAKTAKSDFDPSDDMYCSRCFRKASSKIRNGDPDRKTQINAHSDPNRSCRIPAQEGEVTYDADGMPELPSRAGWIKKPRNFVISTLRKKFLRKHPELEGTFCPTQGSNRGTAYWFQDPNNDEMSDNFGLPFPGDSDDEEEDEAENEDEDEDDGDEDYQDNGEEDDEDDEEAEEEVWEEYEETDEHGVIQRKKRRIWRGPGLPRDPTYQDNGEEDDLSQADPSELVPESDDEGNRSGGKRKRDDSGAAQTGDKTKQRPSKRPKVAEGQNEGEDEEA